LLLLRLLPLNIFLLLLSPPSPPSGAPMHRYTSPSCAYCWILLLSWCV
jgi:hypothetical protein